MCVTAEDSEAKHGVHVAAEFRLDGVVQRMKCPFPTYARHRGRSGADAGAQKLFDAVGSKDKTFRVYTPEEVGAQHCQRDYLTLVCDDIADWLEEKLLGRP